jgi:hypothetical protein
MSENIEQWMNEFIAILIDKDCTNFSFSKKDNGRGFRDANLDTMWTGFLMAKRSMPVVELPGPYIDYDEDDATIKYWTARQLYPALKQSGIQYKVKGE